jgi:hypothetical protein
VQPPERMEGKPQRSSYSRSSMYVRTFHTREEAEDELARIFGDEPTWVGTMRVEPFEFSVEATREPAARADQGSTPGRVLGRRLARAR